MYRTTSISDRRFFFGDLVLRQILLFIALAAVGCSSPQPVEQSPLYLGVAYDVSGSVDKSGLSPLSEEAMLREAKAENIPLSRSRVLAAKAEAIVRASEGTLEVLTTSLTLDDIVGLEGIKRFFSVVSEKLKVGAPTSPRAILMAGPPGTSKSSFAPILANLCGFNIVKFQNVKNMYVGESERRLNLALSLVEDLAPVILFIDEITETTPSRSLNNGDGGVSLDLLGQLFQFSARLSPLSAAGGWISVSHVG